MEPIQSKRTGSAWTTSGRHSPSQESNGAVLDLAHVLVGAFSGLVATGPMTVTMAVLHRYLPGHERYALPPSQITTRVLEEGGLGKHLPEPQHKIVTALAHFAYGAAAGAVYVPLTRSIPLAPVLRGATFGLVVWSVSYLGLLPALGILPPATRHPARRNALMIIAHLVWGGLTGALVDKIGQA